MAKCLRFRVWGGGSGFAASGLGTRGCHKVASSGSGLRAFLVCLRRNDDHDDDTTTPARTNDHHEQKGKMKHPSKTWYS